MPNRPTFRSMYDYPSYADTMSESDMDIVDLADPDTYADGLPHKAFHRLRTEAPVSWQPERAGPGFWAVVRHADVCTVLRTPAVFSSWRNGALLADPPPEFL